MKSCSITRRSFLKTSLLSSLLCLSPFPCAALGAVMEKDPYYTSNKERFVREFEVILDAARDQYLPLFGDEDTELFISRARSEFAAVLLRLPPIGGDKNRSMKFFITGAQYLALYTPMKERAIGPEVIGRIMYDLTVQYYATMPIEERNRERDLFFGESSIAGLDDWASWTQERYYPANWVYEFVPGDWETFDFGYDVKECAVFKLFDHENILELIPYFCCDDFPISNAIGTGLAREKSIGFGDNCCNFRYRKGRKVLQNWDTEISRLKTIPLFNPKV